MSGGKSFCGSGLSARAGRRAFTLIELLVVISVVVLLMALLFPALSRSRKQARAVVCQANLKQWGTLLALYVNENDGRLPQAPDRADGDYAFQGWGGFGAWSGSWYPDTYGDTGDLHFCPMATQVASPSGYGSVIGGTFLAWGRFLQAVHATKPRDRFDGSGSYGFNSAVGYPWPPEDDVDDNVRARAWRAIDVRGKDRIPVYFDHAWPSTWRWLWDGGDIQPPEFDAIPQASGPVGWLFPCINRHHGGINTVFLDWSVRKVGLKELWTLEWHREYETAGPWTKAGGVLPSDWPEWMRGFRDY